LTAQEITPMLRLKLNPIIFLLNNKGYTIERWLHGESRRYNDVVNWFVLQFLISLVIINGTCRKYTQLLSTFGGEEGKTCQSYLVRTPTELEDLLNNEAFLRADKAQLVEVAMDVMDAPRLLKIQSGASIAQNKYAP
jgi:pyruvate decarboxylase